MQSARLSLSLLALLLAGCVYAPVAPVMQRSYAYDRHPGVFLEVWWQYDAWGASYPVTRLVNRGTVAKCAWTDVQDSRLLQAGETWQLSQALTPGNVGVANVMPWDPNCVSAKRDYRR